MSQIVVTKIPKKVPVLIDEETGLKKKKRVCAYARVSTDLEDQRNSYEAQLNEYDRRIKNNPEWEFVGLYSDEGISGTCLKRRDGFQRMIKDALDGKIDLILVKSISRFARNTVDCLKTVRELRTKNVEVKEYDPKETKFIKSHLPFNRAFKIGASSIKTKPFRLIFTILLTTVSLVMFGVTSTFMLYNSSYTYKEALANSSQDYEMIQKNYKYERINYNANLSTGEIEEQSSYKDEAETYFTQEDLDRLNSTSSNNFAGVFKFRSYDVPMTFANISVPSSDLYHRYTSQNCAITGFVDAGSDYMSKNGFSIISGTYPTNTDEIAISEYIFQVLKADTNQNINNYEDVIYSDANKKTFEVRINSNSNQITKKFKITAIYNVGQIPTVYDALKDPDSLNTNQTGELSGKFRRYMSSSFHTLGYVSEGFYDFYYDILKPENNSYGGASSASGRGLSIGSWQPTNVEDNYWFSYFPTLIVNQVINDLTFYGLDGTKIDYKEPVGNQMYVNGREYQRVQREKENSELYALTNIVYNCQYSKESSDLFRTASEARKNNYINAINNYANNRSTNSDEVSEEDILALKQYLEPVLRNTYILQEAQNLYSKFNNEHKNENAKYSAFCSLCDTFFTKFWSDDYDYSDFDTTVTQLDTYLKSFKDEYKEYQLVQYAQDPYWYNNNSKDRSISEEDENAIYYLRDQYYQDSMGLSNQQYESLEDFANKYGVSLKTYGYVGDNYSKEIKVYWGSYNGQKGEMEILGYFEAPYYAESIINDNFIEQNAIIENYNVYYSVAKTDYVKPQQEKYENAVSKTEYSEEQISSMLYDDGVVFYEMTNDIYTGVASIVDMIKTLKTIFLIVGAVTGTFAALMLFNFISSSISSKTKEIGILRAVGAKGSDLFKIFFSESGLIAVICSLIAIAVSIIICSVLNKEFMAKISLKVIQFGIVNVLLVIGGALVITVIGTVIPVLIASKRPPVESIRTL